MAKRDFHEARLRESLDVNRRRYSASRRCVLCGGSGVVTKIIGGSEMTVNCECVENGRPVLPLPKDTSAKKAKIAKARQKKREAHRKVIKTKKRR